MLATGLLAVICGMAAAGQNEAVYHSPYSVAFSFPQEKLIGDILAGKRGGPRDESSIAAAEWYAPSTRKRYGSWGPPARQYPAVAEADRQTVAWQRERIIAVALRFQGYGYQHHHIPDWDPPADWPWKETKSGHNGKGVDCSNFTAFVYNLGLGLKPTGAVREQSEQLAIPGPGPGKTTTAQKIELPKSYAERVRTLQTADLLFVRNTSGEISHVVLWVGSIGRSPDGVPLVLDSHGDGVVDCRGQRVPHGIYLRPFAEKSWYCRSASHAIRILPETSR
jgi:hypothetical protein